MNRTFKVVFNKARGALTVVNEVTSSIQAKGTKTVIAAAAMLIAGTAISAEYVVHPGAAVGYADGKVVTVQSGFNGEASLNDEGVLVIEASGWKTPDGAWGHGVFTNLVRDTSAPQLDVEVLSDLTISGTFTGNESTNAGGAMTLWHDGTADTVSPKHTINGVFTSNHAAQLGGAISLMPWNKFEVQGETKISAEFDGNTSGDKGGAVYSENDNLTVSGSTFTGNTAVNYGGALYLTDTSTKIEGSEFTSNNVSADGGQGGAIYTDGALEIKDTNFTGNSANKYGGAIAGTVEGKGDVTLTGGMFSQNKAGPDNTIGSGGAIALWSNGSETDNSASVLKIDGTKFEGNTASRKGGAIAFLLNHQEVGDRAQATIDHATFTDNDAGYTGGAIQLEYVDATISNTTFEGNTAVENGGAIHVADNATLTLKGTNTFSGNMVGETANDIYSAGKVTIASGETSLSGGIEMAAGSNLAIAKGAVLQAGEIGGSGTLTVENDGQLQVEEATLGAGVHLVLNGAGTAEFTDLDVGAFSAEDQTTGASVQITGGTLTVGEMNVGKNSSVTLNGGKLNVFDSPDESAATAIGLVNNGSITANNKSTITVNAGTNTGTITTDGSSSFVVEAGEFTNDGVMDVGTVAINAGGTLNTSIFQDYFKVDKVTVGDGGVFSIAAYNSKSDNTLTANDRLLIGFGSEWTLAGGELKVENETFKGHIKIGTADNAPDHKGTGVLNVTAGNYEFSKVEFGSAEANALNISGGTVTVATLDTTYGHVNVSGEGTLKTTSDQVFSVEQGTLFAESEDKVADATGVTLNTGISFNGGTLALKDSGYYTTGSLAEMGNALKLEPNNGQLVILNAHLVAGENGETGSIVDGFVQTTVDAEVDAQAEEGVVTITPINAGVQSVTVTSENAQSLAVGKAETPATFTLTGSAEGGQLVKNEEGKALAVSVASNSTLSLGSSAVESETKGSLDSLEVSGTTSVVNMAAVVKDLTLNETGKVTVGNDSHRGALDVDSLSMKAGSSIFLDPAVFGTVADASHFGVLNVTDGIAGEIVAGQNAIVSLGATSAEGSAAVNTMLESNGLAWGTDITSAVYVGSAVTIAESGYVVADGSLTSETFTSAYAAEYAPGTLSVADKGLLAAKQGVVSGDEVLVNGKVSFAQGSTLAIVNATEGEFNLATTVEGTANVITDNPFYEAQLSNGKVVTSQDTANGVSSIASAGLQAMTRRADFVFSQTVADRASIDQELQPGVNLWVDVSGENYQMDGMDYGAEFEADTFYGTFGGDVKLGDAYTLGAAFQYGDGSLRSSVNNIKNDVTNYGLALYGTAKFGAAKVVGELSYIWGENDITASQAALNQSVDTSIYSAGVTGMYELRAGGFSFIPSIGLRVSQLETDAMRVGDVSIEDQDQTLFQIPVALRINGADMNAGGWKLAPSFKIAYVPTFGDTEINVRNIEADVIDTSPVQMDLGLRAGTENLLLNATFSLGAGREGSSSVGGKIGLKYAF